MEFSYDLSHAEMIIHDYVTGDGADIKKGAALGKEGAVTTAEDQFGIGLVNPATCDNFIGVSTEMYDFDADGSGPDSQGDNGATASATGVSNYVKCSINPLAVYRCEYSQVAADDTAGTAASATGKTVTSTFTTDREGDWIYITPVGDSTSVGAGNLFKIGASNSTTSVTACTSYDDSLNAITATDTFIVVTNPYSALAAGGSLDLEATCTKISGVAAAGTGAITVLESYVTDKATPLEPLKVERNSGINYDSATCKLYSDISFPEHMCLGAPRIVA